MLSVVENLFTDNRKIGVILVSLGVTLLVLGVVLFFDSALLAMGNILFLGYSHLKLNKVIVECLFFLVLCDVSVSSIPLRILEYLFLINC